MRFPQLTLNKRYAVYAVGLLAAVLLSANSLTVGAQAANSIYVTPASGSYDVGATVVVSVRENSSAAVNAVQADMSYGANMQFLSIDSSGSAFAIDASSTGGGGSVSIAKGTTSPVSGDQLVAKVSFKVLSAGSGTIQMLSSSVLLSSSNSANVASDRNGATFVVQPPAGTPPPSTPPPSTPTPTPSPSPTAGTKTSNQPSVTVTPSGNSQATPLPGDSKVELQAPITVQTTPDANKDVTKIEYLINGKVVASNTSAPYSHEIDIKKMRNGTYTLTTKTYYRDGKIDTSNSSLVVSNPFGWTQVSLQLRHYLWLIVILLVIAGELVYLKFFRNRHKGYGGGTKGGTGTTDTYGSAGHGSVVVGGTGGTISPSGLPK